MKTFFFSCSMETNNWFRLLFLNSSIYLFQPIMLCAPTPFAFYAFFTDMQQPKTSTTTTKQNAIAPKTFGETNRWKINNQNSHRAIAFPNVWQQQTSAHQIFDKNFIFFILFFSNSNSVTNDAILSYKYLTIYSQFSTLFVI